MSTQGEGVGEFLEKFDACETVEELDRTAGIVKTFRDSGMITDGQRDELAQRYCECKEAIIICDEDMTALEKSRKLEALPWRKS